MKRYLYIGISVLLIGLGIYLGYLFFSNKSPAQAVNSESIVSMLKQEGFLVTQTYIVNERVNINNNSGSVIKDFLWRQEITAFGTMKVNTGVDLTKVTKDDIQVQPQRISVLLPSPEVFSSELVGDLTLINKQGVLKRIFNNESGYNESYQALKNQAITTAATTTLMVESRNNTESMVKKIIQLTVPNREIVVSFR